MEHFRAAQRKLPVLRAAEEQRVLPHTFTPSVDRAEFRAELNRPALHRKCSARSTNPVDHSTMYDVFVYVDPIIAYNSLRLLGLSRVRVSRQEQAWIHYYPEARL